MFKQSSVKQVNKSFACLCTRQIGRVRQRRCSKAPVRPRGAGQLVLYSVYRMNTEHAHHCLKWLLSHGTCAISVCQTTWEERGDSARWLAWLTVRKKMKMCKLHLFICSHNVLPSAMAVSTRLGMPLFSHCQIRSQNCMHWTLRFGTSLLWVNRHFAWWYVYYYYYPDKLVLLGKLASEPDLSFYAPQTVTRQPKENYW